MTTIALAAGGTGGHLYPAIAVAEEITALGSRPLIIGSGKELEKNVLASYPFKSVMAESSGFVGKSGASKLKVAMGLPGQISSLRRILRENDVSACCGFGGYPSFAPVLAAASLGLPTAIFELNPQAGFANRILSFVTKQSFAVPGATGLFGSITDCEVPVRKEFLDLPEVSGKRFLIIGGSQGARNINNAVISLLPLFREQGVSLIHVTGSKNFEEVKRSYEVSEFRNYEVYPYAEKIWEFYERSDVVISRAGAMSVAEIVASGRCGIFVPLAGAGAHQKANISRVLEQNAGFSLVDDEALSENLSALCMKLLEKNSLIVETAKRAKNLHSFSAPARKIANWLCLGTLHSC